MKVSIGLARFWQTSRIKGVRHLRTTIFDNQGIETGQYIPCKVRNAELTEALGQVNFIFSDKKGTLTREQLKFIKILVGRYSFCDREKEVEDEEDVNQDMVFLNLLQEEGKEGDKARQTMRCMALCHSVLYDTDMTYYSTSPIDLALVRFSDKYSHTFQVPENDKGLITFVVEENGHPQSYEFLERFETNAERQRMSMIVKAKVQRGSVKAKEMRENEEEEVVIYTKGRIETMRSLVDLSKSPDMEVIEANIAELEGRGFMATFLAYKIISLQEWDDFADKYYEAYYQPDNKHKISELQKELETGLSALGAGILKEQIQDGVIENIKFMKGAGIRFWVLTDDKTDVTVSTCEDLELILQNTTKIFEFKDPKQIKEAVFKKTLKDVRKFKGGRGFVCLVEGHYFSVIETYKQTNVMLYLQFREILLRSQTAIFTQISGVQKKSVIRMVKEFNSSFTTLSIGDSAEDIYMLHEAHIGIGIEGYTGNKAALTADYSFGEFKHVIPLVFYYGRETYRKNSKLILYLFYSSILVAMPNFWFGFFHFFSPRILYGNLMYVAYPILFSFAPIIYFGVYDKTYPKDKLLFSPLLYRTGMDDFYYNGYQYITSITFALSLSLYMTLICLMYFDYGNYQDGHFFGYWNFGNMCLCGAVLLSNFKIFSISNSFSIYYFLIILLTIVFYFGGWFVLSMMSSNVMFNSFWAVIGTFQFYFYVATLLAMAILEYLFIKMYYQLRELKYVPDFEVKFDADNNLAKSTQDQVDLALSGVSDNKQNNLHHYTQFDEGFSSSSLDNSYDEDDDFESDFDNSRRGFKEDM